MLIFLNFTTFILIVGGSFLWFVGTNEEVKKKTIAREVEEGQDKEFITEKLNILTSRCYLIGVLSVFVGVGLIIARVFA